MCAGACSHVRWLKRVEQISARRFAKAAPLVEGAKMNFSPTCVRHERVKVFHVICTFEDGAWRLSLQSDYQLRKPAHFCARAREISRRDHLILDFLCRADKSADTLRPVKLFFVCGSLLQFHEFRRWFQ